MADAPEPDESGPVKEVVSDWKKCRSLVLQAAGGLMVIVGKEVTRAEVCQNKQVLLPILKHLGSLT